MTKYYQAVMTDYVYRQVDGMWQVWSVALKRWIRVSKSERYYAKKRVAFSQIRHIISP